jgi:hypothetical protein
VRASASETNAASGANRASLAPKTTLSSTTSSSKISAATSSTAKSATSTTAAAPKASSTAPATKKPTHAAAGKTAAAAPAKKDPNAKKALTVTIENGNSTATSASGTPYTTFRSGITSFSPFSVTSTSALPIELISFQANCANNKTVDVTWSTATEHNSYYFRVDKSRDGIQWDVLGTIGAAGHSTNVIDYALTDIFPAPGINYYRLTQYDVNGSYEMFDIYVTVCKDQQSGTVLSVFPNPSLGDFNVELQTEELEGEATLMITDAKGAVVHSQDIKVIKGANNYIIQRSEADPGIYYIIVELDGKRFVFKHSAM